MISDTVITPVVNRNKREIAFKDNGEAEDLVIQGVPMSREEFYETIKADMKAEYINGMMVIQSPAKHEHDIPSNNLFTLLWHYVRDNDLGYAGHEKKMITLTENDFEPDMSYWKKVKAERFDREQWKFPAPDMVVEILSKKTKSVDKKIKFKDYERHGIGEYWIIDPWKEGVKQYLLRKEGYELVLDSREGEIESSEVKGFKIPVRALFDEEEYEKTVYRITGLENAEKARAEAEMARAAAEKARAAAEKARAEAEMARAEADKARAEADKARLEAEERAKRESQTRIEAEGKAKRELQARLEVEEKLKLMERELKELRER